MTDALLDATGTPAELQASWPWNFLQTRHLLARHLVGDGIDIGPGPHPFPLVNPGVTVRYVDRHDPAENAELFPELDDPGFEPPDIVSDLDVDGLGALADESVDFAVASHVLEHVADPLRLLDDVHRVLRAGGVALILLPEPSRTFDRDRRITPLADVLAAFERRATRVPDERVVDFLEGTGHVLPDDPEERRELIELHRRRSVHVHVWDADAFFEVVLYGVRTLGHRWDLVDAVVAAEEGPNGFDFGWVLRRTARPDDAGTVAAQLARSWELWRAHRRALVSTFDELHEQLARQTAAAEAAGAERDQARADLDATRAHLDATRAVLDGTRAELEALLGTKTMRLLGPARRAYARVRGLLGTR